MDDMTKRIERLERVSDQVFPALKELRDTVISYHKENTNEIVFFKKEMEAFKTYLGKDVRTALNSMTELRNQVTENSKDINHIKIIEAQCPIKKMGADVDMLIKETEWSRAKAKFPEINKAMRLYQITKDILLIISTLALIMAIIANLDKIFGP